MNPGGGYRRKGGLRRVESSEEIDHGLRNGVVREGMEAVKNRLKPDHFSSEELPTGMALLLDLSLLSAFV